MQHARRSEDTVTHLCMTYRRANMAAMNQGAPQASHQLLKPVFAVDGYKLIADRIVGSMQADGKLCSGFVLTEAADFWDKTNR